MVFLAQLILILAIVHDPADRRDRRGGYFDQVVSAFLRLTEGVRRRKNAQLLSLRTDHSYFSNPDLTIHTQFGDDKPPPIV
jgi:hypothetical protein